MADTDAFVPDINYVARNVFFLILTVIILAAIAFLIHRFRFRKGPTTGPIKPDYTKKLVSDTIPHNPVPMRDIRCPPKENQYSFTFYLEIRDFYCNRGYWKCIMLKGSSFTGKIECQSDFKETEGDLQVSINNKKTELCNSLSKDDEKEKCNDFFDSLKNNIVLNTKDIKDGLHPRLEAICRAHELDKITEKSFTQAFCDLAAHHQLLKKKDGEGNHLPIREGLCLNYLNRHKLYCDKVYAINKKVARGSDRELLESNKVNKGKYDDYDNICSADNIIQEFPELLPQNIEELKENELLNLSEESKLEGTHHVNKPYSLEGYYEITDDSKSVTGVTSPINEQEVNREAEKEGFEYFGISDDQSKYILLTEADVLGLGPRTKSGSGTYEVRKMRRPEEFIVQNCWKEVLEVAPYQTPGVWLHPYVNNIRIIFTTQTSEDYQTLKNDLVHPNKGLYDAENSQNYIIEKIPAHAARPPSVSPEDSECQVSISVDANNYYREFFDVLNVPVNEEFHLGIVADENTIQVYLNGKLFQSQVLFGKPIFTPGDLQIIPGENKNNVKLGSVVRQFNYFPYALPSNSILRLSQQRAVQEQIDSDIIGNPLEHEHNISVSHTHEFHLYEEAGHSHTVEDDDISKSH